MTPYECYLGDIVEVYCDHKRSGRRIRDWIEGVVVHADDRMTAIQFRNDVYLTDGWMVPDRILWFNKGSNKIRAAKRKKVLPRAERSKKRKGGIAEKKTARRRTTKKKPVERKKRT